MKTLGWLDHHAEGLFLLVFPLTPIILISANVILRYVFNSGPTWSDKIRKYCLIFPGFISISHWIRHKGGICVDALVQVAPGSVKMTFQILVQLIVLAFFLLMFKGAISHWLAIKKSGRVSGTLQTPTTYVYVVPIAGSGLVLLRGVQDLMLGLVRRKKEGSE